jgi:2,5-diamino-6-(ribosylamino)-4(3H)-pyrimidinone 5'-phosphate reductase
MLPYVVIHNVVSVDGRMDWITPDLGQYYGLAATWNADAMLSGSNTLLAAPQEAVEDVGDTPTTIPGSLLVVVDSRGRIKNWPYWRRQPYWRDVLVLGSNSTPQTYLDELQKQQIEYIIAGRERVDLRAALEGLNVRHGVSLVRVDSGGTLNGALLRAGLVNEISLLIHPNLVGGTTPNTLFQAPDLTSAAGVICLHLTHLEQLAGEVVWLRYKVVSA